MLYGILSNDPFEFFDRGHRYNSVDPWTRGFSRYQQPFAEYQLRPQSARRSVRTTRPTSFWDIPVTTEDDEDVERRKRNDLFTEKHSRGERRKCRPKTSQIHDRRMNRLPVQDDLDIPHEGSRDVQVTKNERSKTAKNENINNSSQKISRHRKRKDEQDGESASTCQLAKLKLQDLNEEEERNQNLLENTTEKESKKEDDNLDKNETVNEMSGTSENDDSGETHQPEEEIKEESNEHVTKMDISEAEEERDKEISDKQEKDKEESEKSTKYDKVQKKLEMIKAQLEKARELVPQEILSAPRTDKQRIYLSEMLLRCILDLDFIEAEGNEAVRMSRKEAVREIQSYLDQIENCPQ